MAAWQPGDPPFEVGDLLTLVKDQFSGDPYYARPGDCARVTEAGPTKVAVKWLTGGGVNTTYIGHWDNKHFEKGGTMTPFACRNCGATADFVEYWEAINTSTIDYIDEETGHIEWSGGSELGESTKHLHFACSACDSKYTKADFDPVARIAAAMTDLDDLLDDED